MSASPPPLDAAALDELARKAEAAKARADQTHAPRWYKPFELRSDTDYAEDAEFLAACTPDVILALLAAVRSAEADTARMSRIEWADTVLLAREDEDDPMRRFSFRDMATPPTPENPDGTIYGPTARAVLDAAIHAARAHPPTTETDDA